MKETILRLLKTKFVGVSDNILEGLADKAARTITTEDAAKTHVDELTIQNIIESYADNRVTTATKNAIANYEKKYSIKDGKPTGEGTGDKETGQQQHGDDTPAWAKALIDANNTLRTEIDALKKGKTTETRHGQLQNIINQLTPTQQKAYSRIDVATMDDNAFTNMLAEIKTEVETILAENKAAGAVTKPPMFGAGQKSNPKEASDDEVKAMLGIK